MSEEKSVAAAENCGPLSKYCPVTLVETGIDAGIARLRRLISPAIFQAIVNWTEKIGHLAIYVALVLGLIFAVIAAIRMPDFELLYRAVIFIFTVALMQYVSFKLFRFNDLMLSRNRERVCSATIFDLLALVCFVGGVLLLAGDIYLAIKYGPDRLGYNLVRFLTIEATGVAALNFRQLNLEENADAGIGETALALLAFAGKALLPLARVVFGLFSVLTVIGLIRALIKVCDKMTLWESVDIGLNSVQIIRIAICVPVVATLLYLAIRLLTELCQSVLARNNNR